MRKIFLLLMTAAFGFAGNAAENPLWLRYPSISPDGKTIVFSYQGDLYRVAASGGQATPLTCGGA